LLSDADLIQVKEPESNRHIYTHVTNATDTKNIGWYTRQIDLIVDGVVPLLNNEVSQAWRLYEYFNFWHVTMEV
jgi:hypothetical protein